MNKFLLLSSITFISILLTSCMYGNTTNREFTSLSSTNCIEKASEIKLFFSGENIDISYKKVGIIKVQADQYDTKAELLDHLRHEARNNCADAIINIQEKQITRKTGFIFEGDNDYEQYESLVYTGIAVRTENFKQAASTQTPKFSQEVKKEDKRDSDTAIAGGCLGAIGIIILLIVGTNQ